jgi:hypothetical protein
MAKELNEDTGFTVSVKTLIAVGFAMATIIGMWFALQADIAEAKELPKPDVSRMEFQMILWRPETMLKSLRSV